LVKLQPITADHFSALRGLVGAPDDVPELGYTLEAAIAGTAPLVGWADDLLHPSFAYLWDERVLHYVFGERTAEAEEAVAWLYREELLPALLARTDRFVLARYSDAKWGEGLPGLTGLARYPRVAYLRTPDIPLPQSPLPKDYHLVEIGPALLADKTLLLDSLHDEIASVWPSPQHFLAHGWGFGVLFGRELVTWCTAEEISPGRCGVGIWTHEAHRRLGLASSAAVAYATRCAQRGLVALWDAWAGNAPSRHVAERCGWSLRSEYTVLAGQIADA